MNRRPREVALSPRKTATQKRAAKTVEAIIEAAARILETHGFDGYTTNAIATRAGVSIGSLYQYFPNKDAITLALIAREAAILLDETLEAAALEDWREAMDRMVGAAMSHQLRRPILARLLDVEEERLRVGDDRIGVASAIYEAVRGLIVRGAFETPDGIEKATEDVIGITRGITDMAGRLGTSHVEELMRRVNRAVLGYLQGSARAD